MCENLQVNRKDQFQEVERGEANKRNAQDGNDRDESSKSKDKVIERIELIFIKLFIS